MGHSLLSVGESAFNFGGDLWEVLRAQEGDSDAFESLLKRHHPMIRGRARQYYLQGGEFEDLLQEAILGFYKAIRDYQPTRGSFLAFAELCVTRQIITAVKSASRLKHSPLNSSRSLDEPAYGDEGRILAETISLTNKIDEDFLTDYSLAHLLDILRNNLTSFQFSTLTLWLAGYSYHEIAQRLGRHYKAIDNGLTSVKDKIRRLQERGVLPSTNRSR